MAGRHRRALSCQPAADDEACDTCLKTSCCDALSTCGSACQELGACISLCDTQACAEACYAASPAGAAQFDALTECGLTSCAASCGAEEPEPTACLATPVPAGYCTDPQKPVGHDCPSGVAPYADCVLLPNAANVYCCAR